MASLGLNQLNAIVCNINAIILQYEDCLFKRKINKYGVYMLRNLRVILHANLLCNPNDGTC